MKNKKQLIELEDIITEYDELLNKACGCGIYSSDDYDRMDFIRNKAYEIVNQLIIQ